MFESLGLAAEDLAAASYLYEKATRLAPGPPLTSSPSLEKAATCGRILAAFAIVEGSGGGHNGG